MDLKCDLSFLIGSNWFRIKFIGVFFNTVGLNEPSDFLRGGEFLDKLSAYSSPRRSLLHAVHLFISAITVLSLYFSRKLLKGHAINI
jgi:hypothetical protein